MDPGQAFKSSGLYKILLIFFADKKSEELLSSLFFCPKNGNIFVYSVFENLMAHLLMTLLVLHNWVLQQAGLKKNKTIFCSLRCRAYSSRRYLGQLMYTLLILHDTLLRNLFMLHQDIRNR